MRKLLGFAALAASLAAQTTAKEELNRGVDAFRSASYPEAAEHFKAALALDASLTAARLYLGSAYFQQFVPGAETPENRGYAEAAIEQYQEVLVADPNNLLATQYLASTYYNLKDFGDAEAWNRRVIAIDPANLDAYYTLGVVAWTAFIKADREARVRQHMRPEDPAPLKDEREGQALKARYWDSLTQGIEYQKRALEINPEYANAMAYLNLLIRYRADLDDSAQQAQADVSEADEWFNKVLAIRAKQTPDKVNSSKP
jgi:tetratricopeptide (TPR) repeat protein